MKREELAKRIHWPIIIWTARLVNVTAMMPQLLQIIKTHNVAGLSLGMFVIYLVVQIAFSLEGYFTKNRMLMVCLGLSAFISASIITLVCYYR
ncbi:MAG: PQ-loop domain-containing transporter [Patescibacteria group bacterium]